MEIENGAVVLCEFYFSDFNSLKNRPVMVLRKNLPYNDFAAIPISSKIENLFPDEMIIDKDDFETGCLPVKSKMMLRKTFVVSNDVVKKKYGKLKQSSFHKFHKSFCEYFECCNF